MTPTRPSEPEPEFDFIKDAGDGHGALVMRTPPTDEARATDFEEEAVWAHVVMEPETHAPALLSDAALEEINVALADIGAGHFIGRAWIQPGPLLEEGAL